MRIRQMRVRGFAFTLVELLVVITVMGILSALLFPVIARAKEGGRRNTCLSNERQLAVAFSLYAQDSDERLAPGFEMSTSGVVHTASGAPATWDVLLLPYMKSRAIIQCPSDINSNPMNVSGLGTSLFRSYTVAEDVAGRALSEIPASARTVLLLEAFTVGIGQGSDPWAFWVTTPRLGKATLEPEFPVISEYPTFPHNDMANFAFLDGHVRALKGPHPAVPGYRTNDEGIAICGMKDPLPQ